MEDLAHVAPEDPLVISAAAWNLIVDSAREYRANGPRTRGAGSPAANLERPALMVRVKAGATLPVRAIVTLGDAITDPTAEPLEASRGPLFDAVAPAAGGVPAVLLGGLASGEIGRAVVQGVCVASVVISSSAHTHARPVVGDTSSLESAKGGPFRLLTNPGPGTADCLVLLTNGVASDAGTPSGADSCAAALMGDSSNCYLVTVVSASGLCSTVDTAQSIELTWDAGNSDHRSGATDWENADASTGQIVLDVSVYPPTATVDGASGRYLDCSGDGGLLFAWKGNPPCATGTATACEDALVLRFDCQCCSIAGWGGADKWYCTEAGTLFLTEDDRCDTDIVIVSGPYDTEEDADAACGTYPLAPSTTGCPDPGNIVAGQSGQFTVAPGAEHYFRATGLTELTDYHVDLTADSGRGAKLRYLTNIVDPCVGTTTTRADVSVGGSDCVTITTAAGETEIVFWVTVATTGSGDSTYTIAFNNGVC